MIIKLRNNITIYINLSYNQSIFFTNVRIPTFIILFILLISHINPKNKRMNRDQSCWNQRQVFDKCFTPISSSQFQKRFINKDQIGQGVSSTVIKAIDIRQNNRPVALKRFKTKILNDYQLYKDVIREIQISQSLKEFPEFLDFYDKFKVTSQTGKDIYYLVEELCEGSLGDLMKQNQLMNLPFLQRLEMCVTLAKQLKILHGKDIIHRDLKPDNILLRRKNHKIIPIIGDFGNTKRLQLYMTACKGTPLYIHPNHWQKENYSYQYDTYSFGLIILKMLTGKFIMQITPEMNNPSNGIKIFHQKLKPVLNSIEKTLDKFELDGSLKKIIQICLNGAKFKNALTHQIVKELETIYMEHVQENERKKSEKKLSEEKISTTCSNIDTERRVEDNMQKQIQENIIQQQYSQNILRISLSSILENTNNSVILDQSQIKKTISLIENTNKHQKFVKQQGKLEIQQNQQQAPIRVQSQQNRSNIRNYNPLNKNKFCFYIKLLSTRRVLEQNIKNLNEKIQQTKCIKQLEQVPKKIQLLLAVNDIQGKYMLLCLAYMIFRARLISKQQQQQMKHNQKAKIIEQFLTKISKIFTPIIQKTRSVYKYDLKESTKQFLQYPNNPKHTLQNILKQYASIANYVKVKELAKQVIQ